MNSVEQWFGEDFQQLDPLLQQLHQQGGVLQGKVDVGFGSGLAGLLGQRLAAKLGVPNATGEHAMRVSIAHKDKGLIWGRCFNEASDFVSVFEPVDSKAEGGYWLEQSGALKMAFTVEIKDGGWYWHCIRCQLGGVRLPLWLLPKSDSYKCIEEGAYVFSVSFSLPLLGQVLNYNGKLVLQKSSHPPVL